MKIIKKGKNIEIEDGFSAVDDLVTTLLERNETFSHREFYERYYPEYVSGEFHPDDHDFSARCDGFKSFLKDYFSRIQNESDAYRELQWLKENIIQYLSHKLKRSKEASWTVEIN